MGENSGSVINSYNTGTVTGTVDSVGGVVGYNDIGGSVTNCYNTGSVTSSGSNVGGVVGYNVGPVKNCYNTGQVKGSGNYVGGVVGQNIIISSTVTGCYFLQQGELQGIGDGSGTTGATAVTTLDALCKNFKSDPWTISPFYNHPVLKTNPEGGLGTATHPYEIKTIDQLKTFRDIVNGASGNPAAWAVLMEIIDLKGSETNPWTPIGNSSSRYSGTFDGNNYTISGLYIDSTAGDQGLFGYVYGGTVKNLNVSGTVSGGWYVGGVVGYNYSGIVTGCTFSGSGSVSVTGSYYVGGVVGGNSGSNGVVENCHNAGKVSGSNTVGGVVGDNSGSSTVENCYNTGTVTGPSTNVGGVVGDNRGTVENCYNTDNISGGISGGVVGQNSGPVKNCYNTGEVSGSEYVGGVVGYNDSSSTVENCYYQTGKGATVGIGNETTADTSKAEGKTDAQFASGEVAHLLEQNVADSEKPVWGQSNLTATTSLPTLVALNPDAAQPVYKVTFKYGYDSAPENEISYTNGSVKFPTFERTGHTLTGWQNDTTTYQAGEEVEITADTEFTAQWTKNTVNYTVTVSADPEAGGTVSGSGEYSEGTQVTVTATPATGYRFVNWTENGTEVSTEATFTFNATVDRNLIAIFAKNEEPTPTPTPDPTPSGPSTDGSTGWDDIRDELENAAKGDQITIDMGDETKVPAEIFESVAGKDVDVTFDLGDDLSWTVNGKDIPDDAALADLDLGVALDTDGIPANVINTITGEVGTVQITLAHDGEFGFTMTLTAPLGKENAGYWANLYHYDEDAETLNFEAAAKIDEDGSVTIPFSHASQYAIVIDTHSHATVDVSDLFSDIAPDAWYKDAVQYAYDQGLMTGVSATEFAPEATTTRAMIVSILARLENVTTAQAAGFADVNDEWYATAVNWAANVGVVNGYEDNTFKPNTAITREQLAAILMNYAAYKGYDVSARADLSHYSDADSISSWANDVLLWAVAEGLLTGVTDDTIAPQAHATRAQVAAILQRFLSE